MTSPAVAREPRRRRLFVLSALALAAVSMQVLDALTPGKTVMFVPMRRHQVF